MSISTKTGGRVLTAGAAAFAGYVLTHPRGAVKEASTLDEAIHSMAIEPAWVGSHVIGLGAALLIAAGVGLLLRAGWLSDDRQARRSAWLLLAGAVAAAVELVPHTFVASETAAISAGGSTPLTDLHVLFQATLLPVYGLGVAALAVTGLRRVAHPVACALGAVGGLALVVVGPTLFISGNPALGVLFMPAGGTVIFLLAAGLRLARSGVPQPALTAT